VTVDVHDDSNVVGHIAVDLGYGKVELQQTIAAPNAGLWST
jgi:hypothetical protein